MRKVFSVLLALALLLAGCAPANSLELANFSENGVRVTVRLVKTTEGGFQLEAQFTPPDGYHLYSKDIPKTGVEGLGRPTLLELPAGSSISANGPLSANVAAEIPAFEPKELLVYPAGPVTLTLPVSLPDLEQFETTLSVTYMACSGKGCKPPVLGKLVTVSLEPGKLP